MFKMKVDTPDEKMIQRYLYARGLTSPGASRGGDKTAPIVRYYFQEIQSAAAATVSITKSYIEHDAHNATRTGKDRKAAGGRGPGRVDSGKLVDSFSYHVVKNGNKYEYRIGWNVDPQTPKAPAYVIYQELGFRKGEAIVKGMNAIGFAANFFDEEMDMRIARRGFRTRTKWDTGGLRAEMIK